MKKGIIILIVFLFSGGVTKSQTFNWITPGKPYLKLYVINDAIYRINKSDFLNAGVNPDNIDPRTVKVLCKGIQTPIFFYGENDGVFNDTDYFDFFGERNYGGISNVYEETGGQLIVKYTLNEYYNSYSDTNIYWIDWGSSYGLRYNILSNSGSIYYPQNYFYDKIHFENNQVYSLGEKRGPNDFRYFNNERVLGEGWYWRELARGNNISDTAAISNIEMSGTQSFLKIFAYPNSYSDSLYNEHRLIFKLNSATIDTLYRDDYNRFDTTVSFQTSVLNNNTNNNFSFVYTNPLSYAGYLYFDFFEISYPRKFILLSNRLNFDLSGNDTTINIFRITGINNTLQVNIYDVRNNEKIANYSINDDSLFFSGRKNGNFFVENNYISSKPLRIKIRSVPDLINPQNGCDYLIIYNKLFETQAEQLRIHRNSFNGFRSSKAEIEDIYDIFNYGNADPVAIKNFIKYIYNNWQSPKVRYLALFGRGSLDPKKYLSNSDFYENFIPIYGNPPTDGYFVNFNEGSYTYYHQVAVGRIPAYTTAEASDIVNKIINYDNTQLDRWIKNFIFITGGQNLNEQIQFANQSNSLINSFIFPPSVSGVYTRIYRNDSSGYITYNYQDSIIKSINSGSLIVNYIGHAATDVWDNGLDNPNDLNNGSKTPLVFSMTCFTGKNSEANRRSFGEKFLYIPGKCAIGFIGTTGWSFSGSGNQYNTYLFQGLASDSVRMLGDLVKNASIKMSPDSMSFPSKNTINCYNLIGDPASKLLLPTYPEFDIQQNDYWVSNPYPSLKEDFVFKIFPKNIGTYADSNLIRFLIFRNNSQIYEKDTVIRNVRHFDTLTYFLKLDSAGTYFIKVILDPNNWYLKDGKTNNTATFPVLLKNTAFVPVKPVNNFEFSGDTIVFTGLNPNINFSQNQVKVILQTDTSNSFNSPLLLTFFKIVTGGVYTNFIIPNLSDFYISEKFQNRENKGNSKDAIYSKNSELYYWRMNSVINGTDSSGWSEIRNIIISSRNNYSFEDTIITTTKKYKGQFEQSELNNVEFSSNGIELKKYTGNLVAQSWGGYFYDATYFTINESQVFFIDSSQWSGIHIAKVRKPDGKLTELRHFPFKTSFSNDSLFNYLENFDTNYVLMVVKTIPSAATLNFNTQVRTKFKQFGSIYIDSVNLQSNSKWSFISYRGLPFPLTSEAFERTQYIPVVASMNPQFMFSSGSISSTFGTSDKWQQIRTFYQSFQNSILKYNLSGINNSGQITPLYINKNLSEYINIDTINSEFFPFLKLDLNIGIDTVNLITYYSPVINSYSVNYTPPCELIPDNNSVIISDSMVQEGDTVRITFNNFNAGYRPSISTIYKWYANTLTGVKIIRTDTLNNIIPVDSFILISSDIPTAGLKNPALKKDTVFVFCEIKNKTNEFYYYNNTIAAELIIEGDSLEPNSEITFDGVKVNNGDYIQKNPSVIMKFFDNSPIYISDTSNIKIKLNNIYIPYYIGSVKNPVIDIQFMLDNYLQAIVTYNPILNDGENKFEFISLDANGNRADTVRYYLNATSDFRIIDLYNYPNPMRDNTYFIFNLSGGLPPEDCKIKIFSVAGKLIKTINFIGNIGFNSVFWDGRDDDGDYIANGIYFYKLIVKGNSGLETKIEKIAVLK